MPYFRKGNDTDLNMKYRFTGDQVPRCSAIRWACCSGSTGNWFTESKNGTWQTCTNCGHSAAKGATNCPACHTQEFKDGGWDNVYIEGLDLSSTMHKDFGVKEFMNMEVTHITGFQWGELPCMPKCDCCKECLLQTCTRSKTARKTRPFRHMGLYLRLRNDDGVLYMILHNQFLHKGRIDLQEPWPDLVKRLRDMYVDPDVRNQYWYKVTDYQRGTEHQNRTTLRYMLDEPALQDRYFHVGGKCCGCFLTPKCGSGMCTKGCCPDALGSNQDPMWVCQDSVWGFMLRAVPNMIQQLCENVGLEYPEDKLKLFHTATHEELAQTKDHSDHDRAIADSNKLRKALLGILFPYYIFSSPGDEFMARIKEAAHNFEAHGNRVPPSPPSCQMCCCNQTSQRDTSPDEYAVDSDRSRNEKYLRRQRRRRPPQRLSYNLPDHLYVMLLNVSTSDSDGTCPIINIPCKPTQGKTFRDIKQFLGKLLGIKRNDFINLHLQPGHSNEYPKDEEKLTYDNCITDGSEPADGKLHKFLYWWVVSKYGGTTEDLRTAVSTLARTPTCQMCSGTGCSRSHSHNGGLFSFSCNRKCRSCAGTGYPVPERLSYKPWSRLMIR